MRDPQNPQKLYTNTKPGRNCEKSSRVRVPKVVHLGISLPLSIQSKPIPAQVFGILQIMFKLHLPCIFSAYLAYVSILLHFWRSFHSATRKGQLFRGSTTVDPQISENPIVPRKKIIYKWWVLIDFPYRFTSLSCYSAATHGRYGRLRWVLAMVSCTFSPQSIDQPDLPILEVHPIVIVPAPPCGLWFPKIGPIPKSSYFSWDFSHMNQLFLGSPSYGNTMKHPYLYLNHC